MCYLSPTPTAAATDPPPANSPTINIRLVCKERIFCLGKLAIYPKTSKYFKPKNFANLPIKNF